MVGGRKSGLGPGLVAGLAWAAGLAAAAGNDLRGEETPAGCGGAAVAVAGDCPAAAVAVTASLAPFNVGTAGARRSCSWRMQYEGQRMAQWLLSAPKAGL